MKASPAMSEGARLERKAFREYLRRLMRVELAQDYPEKFIVGEVLEEAIDWVLQRQKRYDKKPGGLGR